MEAEKALSLVEREWSEALRAGPIVSGSRREEEEARSGLFASLRQLTHGAAYTTSPERSSSAAILLPQ